MDDDLIYTEPEVEAWYGAELKRLHSVNDQVAFYYVNRYDSDNGDAQKTSGEAVSNANRADALRLPKQIHTSLDPFVALPGGVNECQRLRIQLYAQNLGAGIFGISETPKYSPTAATAISTAFYSDVGREWICILIDEILNSLRGGPNKTKELLQQRALGYQHLNQALRARHDHYQEALMALIICGLTEHRFGTSKARDMHTTATDMFLQSKGSIKDVLTAAPNVEPFYISAQFGFGKCYFSSWEKVENVKANWKLDLLGTLANPRPICNPALVFPLTSEALRREYRLHETRVIKLAVDATKTIETPTPFAAAMQLSLLTEVAWTILQLSARFDIAIHFFKRVEHLVKGSFIGGGSGDRSFELRAAALATMVSRARRDILSNYYPSQLTGADATITSIHINSLKMFHYLHPEGGYLVISKFCTWLKHKENNPYKPVITESEIASLDIQISENWLPPCAAT